MPILFLDASAVVKLYVEEQGSELLLRHVGKVAPRMALGALSRIECRSALRRKQRLEKLEQAVVDDLLLRFESDFASNFTVQPINNQVMDEAVRITDSRHLRAYDAVQLASCVVLARTFSGENVQFACADHQLIRAATAEGMIVMDVSGGDQ